MTFRHRRFPQSMLAFATTLIFVFTILLPQISYAVSVQSSRLPHPFQFTENKGQWDSAVLYKCEVRRDGFTWFLERDGVTLVTSAIDSSSVIAKAPNGACGNPLFSTFPNTQSLPPNSYSIGGAGLRACDPLVSGKFPLKSHALKFKFVVSRRGESQSARRRQSHSPLSVQDALTCRCEERSEGSSAVGGKPQRSDEAIYSFKDSMIQEEITFGEPFGIASSFHFGSASHVPTFIPRKDKIRIQDTRLGRMPYAPTEKYSTQEDVGINSDLRKYTCAKWIDAQGERSWHNNYFLGNDSSKWAPDCRNFTRVVYHEVWEGIDVEWYESKGHLEFDFVVHPGADPKQIKMVCEGLDAPIAGGGRTLLSVDSDISVTKGSRTGVSDLHLSNELSLPTSLGELRMSIPGAYQTTSNGTRGNAVTAQFRLETGNVFAIDLPNGYDASQTLRIDPLVYSTYLGGSGGDRAEAIVSDRVGGTVMTGHTSSTDFPTTPGTGDPSANGYSDCFIAKIDSIGSNLLYGTYLGGSYHDEGMSVDYYLDGSILVTGETQSQNFPVTANSRPFMGSRNAFVTKIGTSGSNLVYSILLGGVGISLGDWGETILDDGSGGCYVAGFTDSPNFPTTSIDTTLGGESDGFITHIGQTGLLFASTYLGGSGGDFITDVRISSDSSLYVCGFTNSNDFPTTLNAYSTTLHSTADEAFIVKMNITCTQLMLGTYLGGGARDGASSLKVMSDGSIVVVGTTASPDFPVQTVSFDTIFNAQVKGYIAILSSNLSTLLASTYLGGNTISNCMSLDISQNGNLTISGITTSINFPTTSNALQRASGGLRDGFFAVMNRSCSHLLYSSYLGGSNDDECYAHYLKDSNNVVLTGWTASSNFPLTPGSFDTTYTAYTSFLTNLQFEPEVSVINVPPLPVSERLLYAYPNPFNSTTTLSYILPITSHVDLRLYDLTGREVSTLVQREQHAGTYRLLLDGSRLASGTYFVRLQAGTFSKTQKIVLLK